MIVSASYAEDNPDQPIPLIIIHNIEKNAQEWASTCTSLSPLSLEVLANFLYFSYRHAHLDEQTGKAIIELKKIFPRVRTQLRNNENPLPTTSAYLRASKRFFVFNGLRYRISLCWQQCVTYLESIEDPALDPVYEQLQMNGQNAIAEYLASTTTVPISLTSLQKNLAQTTKQLEDINVAIKALFEKIDLSTIPLDRFIDTNSALYISNQIQKTTDLLSAPIAALDLHQNNLFLVGTYLFRHHYDSLYSYLPTASRRILFGPGGMLPEQDQYQLPPPNSTDNFFKSIA